MNKYNIIFIGTSDFGVPLLRKLAAEPEFRPDLVISQPDKKAGRGQTQAMPPVKTEALKLGLSVRQPVGVGEVISELTKLKPDLIIVAAYAQMIPDEILALPRFGAINVHASLLPKYRGAACIQGAIRAGDPSAGVTIMKMDKGLDTGPVIAQESLPITSDDTSGSLFDKLARLGADLFIPTMRRYISGELSPEPQNASEKSYCPTLKKQDGRIDWTEPALNIERFIRAMTPWPSAFSYLEADGGLMIKIIESAHEPADINLHAPGTLFTQADKLFIQCGQKALEIKKLQPAGKNVLTSAEFLRGYARYIGKILQ